MLNLIHSVNFNPISIPDHSLLTCEIKLPEKRIKCDVSRNENVKNINRKHKLNAIPENFLSDTELVDSLQDTINRIENTLNVNNDVQTAYHEFCVVVKMKWITNYRFEVTHGTVINVLNRCIHGTEIQLFKNNGSKCRRVKRNGLNHMVQTLRKRI
jgi:hypothetical protein